MRFKKIGLFSAHSFSKPGGVQNHVAGLYKEFCDRGIQTKIIAPGRIKPQGVPSRDVLTVGVTSHIPANQSQAEFSVSIRRRFRQKILEERFDVLHFHNLGLGPLSYQILRHSQALHILTAHVAGDASSIAKIPFVQKIVHDLYEKKLHGVIAISPTALETVQSFGGFNNGPIDIIPNGIDLTRFFISSPRQRGGEEMNLLFVGRFEKRKGLIHLLRACHILISQNRPRNLRLCVVGDGEQRKEAQHFIQKNGLAPHVYFAGSVSDDILPTFYKAADIFCAPSLCGESFGVTLLEAMACGTPIAGFANPGYAYLMQGHEKYVGANVLAKSGDYISLAKKIEMLQDNKRMFSRARDWGLARVQEFAWPQIAHRILNFYEKAKEAHLDKRSL